MKFFKRQHLIDGKTLHIFRRRLENGQIPTDPTDIVPGTLVQRLYICSFFYHENEGTHEMSSG